MSNILKAAPARRRPLFERVLQSLAPGYALKRKQASRALDVLSKRNYEAANYGRRARHVPSSSADAAATASIQRLADLSRNLVRNNGWARRALQIIENNVIGRGIKPRIASRGAANAWQEWASSPRVELRGRANFYQLQRQIVRSCMLGGSTFVIRHDRGGELRIEVLEMDYLDKSRADDGIEYDEDGAAIAYWLHSKHPSEAWARESRRVSAERVAHIYAVERPGQRMGVSQFAAAINKISDFDDYEDAILMQQKIAACFGAFVTDLEGEPTPIGTGEDEPYGVDGFEPGMIEYLAPGQDIRFATPPNVSDNSQFARTQLHAIAKALGVTYEDLTGDYSSMNFSSARMSRLSHYGDVKKWQHDILIPQLCEPVWQWFQEVSEVSGVRFRRARPVWTPPPMDMIDPEKEAEAYKKQIRSGAITLDQMILERGGDPSTHWQEYAAGMERLDELGIVLDVDPRKTTAQGNAQTAGADAAPAAADGGAPIEE